MVFVWGDVVTNLLELRSNLVYIFGRGEDLHVHRHTQHQRSSYLSLQKRDGGCKLYTYPFG